MSQSRFSIVLVGVSALLRRPLVSRLRPADGERSPWVVFAARVGRFESGFRSASWPSDSPLPLFGTHRFGDGRSAGWPSGSLLPFFGMHRFGDCPRRVGLRAHCFRFSARTASEWPLGEFVLPPSVSEIPLGGLVFGFTASAFRHAPIRSCPRRVGLRAHCFRFSARADSEWPLGGWPSGLLLRRLPFGGLAFGLTASEIPLGGLAFGLTASAFRHAPFRSGRWASSFFRLPLRSGRSAGWPSGFCFRFSACTASELPSAGCFFRLPLRRFCSAGWFFRSAVGLRAHCFRFSACTASEWSLGEFVLPPSASEIPLGGLAFGLTTSAFRHAPLRSCRWAGWPSGSPLPLFGMRRSAPLHRRSEDRRSTTTRHLFHFKTLIPTC